MKLSRSITIALDEYERFEAPALGSYSGWGHPGIIHSATVLRRPTGNEVRRSIEQGREP